MHPLYTTIQFESARSRDKLSLQCEQCHKPFELTKHRIQQKIRESKKHRGAGSYCSPSCAYEGLTTTIQCACGNCGTPLFRTPLALKTKTGHVFCSSSCSATYTNTHKTTGIRRSKLEIWLETQLSKLYPTLEIHYCRKDAINGELDIYIPSLKLAFELNGVFHYEPIYGTEKLAATQTNDGRKHQACTEMGIELCIIDTSRQKYFKESTAKPYLNIIKQIIDAKITN